MGVDYDKMLKLAEEKGWTVKKTGGGHLEVRSPDGKSTVHASSSPGDHRAALNLRADLRRAGLNIPAQPDPKQEARQQREEGRDALGDSQEAQEVPHAGKGELVRTLRAIFSEQPEHVFTLEELWTRTHVRAPHAKRTSMEQTIYTMRARGEIKRLDQGQYMHVASAPPAPVREASFQAGGIAAGAALGDERADEDARILDEALAAIGKMQDRIVERVRAVVEEEVQRALEPLAKIDTVVRGARESLAAVARARAALSKL